LLALVLWSDGTGVEYEEKVEKYAKYSIPKSDFEASFVDSVLLSCW
jgi:hypothetical protein